MFRTLPAIFVLAATVQAAPLKLGRAIIDDTPAITTVTVGSVRLQIDWLNQTPAPTAFEQTPDPLRGTAISTHRLGSTGITRTILVTDDAVFLHFIADKPGELSFKTTLVPPDQTPVTLENRRELAWAAPDTEAARAWIIPFESDVESENPAIFLRGEGECLVVFAHTSRENPAKPIAATWQRLAGIHDPEGTPPDPTKIWQAISARAAAP